MPVSFDIIAVVVALLIHAAVQVYMLKSLMHEMSELAHRIDRLIELSIRADERGNRSRA